MSASTAPFGTSKATVSTPGSAEIARQVLESVTHLAAGFRDRALETEQRRYVSQESIRELSDAGVFKMTIPVEYGGYALNPSQICPVFAEIARACGSTGWVAWLTTTGVHPATIFPHQFQDELFGPGWEGPLQSGAISNFAPGTGRRIPGGLMIKGKWAWVSACHHTRFHIVSVMVNDDDGGKMSMTCQVPHEQVEILDDWTVMGMQGTGSNAIILRDEVFVPEHRVLKTTDLFMGVRPAPQPAGTLYKISFASLGAVTIASLAIGLARAAIEEFLKKATSGRGITFTCYADQSKAPVTHLQLGEMWAKLNGCEAIVEHWTRRIESDAQQNLAATPLQIGQVRAAAGHVCRLAKEIADTALRASGASSIHQSSPLQRIMRDATTISVHAQTNVETVYEDLGRLMAGLPSFTAPRKSEPHP